MALCRVGLEIATEALATIRVAHEADMDVVVRWVSTGRTSETRTEK